MGSKRKTATPENIFPPLSRRQFVAESALFLGTWRASPILERLSLATRTPSKRGEDASRAQINGNVASLGNGVIEAEWHISSEGLRLGKIQNYRASQVIQAGGPAFSLTLSGGSQIASHSMRLIEPPKIENLSGDPLAARFAERLPGQMIAASFKDARHGLRASWRAILRNSSHYIRQEVAFSSLSRNLPITAVNMLLFDVPAAEVSGQVKGSPVTARTWFFGFESPLAESSISNGQVCCALQRQLPLERGHSASYSSVIGIADPGQLRRDFLRYIERERAHPYRTFLHYNSWFDLGYFTPYDQHGAFDVIHAFGQELARKRNAVLDSFLFDDGWDNHKSLWSFNSGFPNGFTPVKETAAQYRAAPGIWLSPWGGYEAPKRERLEYGKQQGFEENSGGFVLSGPRYFNRFRKVCLEMIEKYGVNQFKFDGTGNASSVFPGSKFDSDFAAMISLIGDLRQAEPNLYVNLTSGTYPSPFWLRYADSIWRGGDDTSFVGVGSNRQQWITYRDADTYEHVVRAGPLYPLNSLMLHGLVYARHAEKLNDDPSHDFASEIHSYFGTGTQLQEMYITHSLLSDSDWNTLATAAKWSRRNADILVDTHWIGGDPAKLEVYGWSAWSPRGGIVTLRNPDKVSHSFDLDVQTAFELPLDASQSYVARSVWSENPSPIELHAGQSHTVTLQPFEVLALEATPR